MTVLEIVREYLTAHGYDGLYNEYADCGCALNDFPACGGESIDECCPGYRVACTPDCDHDGCDGEGAWHLQKDKPLTQEQVKQEEADAAAKARRAVGKMWP